MYSIRSFYKLSADLLLLSKAFKKSRTSTRLKKV
jgi:hypothetical protein